MKHDKIVLLAKSKINSIKVLIFKALIHSNISRDEYILINNVMKEFHNMKQCHLKIKQCYLIVWSVEKTNRK